MKKRILSLLCAAALVAGLSVPAMAAGESAIKVQLDGQNLTFTDAVPTAKEGRTYLPARTVLEALGATVTPDAAAGTVTAVRDGKTLVMTIGSTEATLTENGRSTALTMDAAPYVENYRTYVPVRFAAQAFGCAVGYDGSKQTVVLVDAVKLADTAIKNNSYTLLEKAAAFSEKYSTGNWAADGSASMNISAMGVDKLAVANAVVKAFTSGQTAFQMDMKMDMDMTGIATLMTSMTGQQPTAEELKAMKVRMDMDMRMDLSTGKYYFKMDGLPADSGFPSDAWISMDLGKLLAQSGVDLDMGSLLQSQTPDPADLIALPFSQLNVDDSTASYGMCTILAQSAAATFADDAFEKTANGYVNKIDFDQDGMSLHLNITLTTNAKGDVTAFQIDGSVNEDLSVMVTKPGGEALKKSLDSLAAMGITMDEINLGINAALDSNGTATVKLSMDMGDLASIAADTTLKYTATDKKAETTPPAGAKVIDWMDLMNATLPTK